VENAIRHGLELAQRGGHLGVSAVRQDDLLEITVTDDGQGFAPEKRCLPPAKRDTTAGSGFGLDAVRARLRSKYADTAHFEICSPYPPGAAGGTRVTLRLPLHMPTSAATS